VPAIVCCLIRTSVFWAELRCSSVPVGIYGRLEEAVRSSDLIHRHLPSILDRRSAYAPPISSSAIHLTYCMRQFGADPSRALDLDWRSVYAPTISSGAYVLLVLLPPSSLGGVSSTAFCAAATLSLSSFGGPNIKMCTPPNIFGDGGGGGI
jgi:hypothetical protein